jgi:hypothetical protein
MRERDFDTFASLLDDVAGLKREAYTAGQKAMFFRALSRYTLDEVRRALDAHVKDPQRGRFLPMPADVIAQVHGMVADDGRVGGDEAWSIALAATDEERSVVWTDEIAQAWSVARNVLRAGDEVGARMAFREAYSRLVDAARQQRAPVAWRVSLGLDKAGQKVAIDEAVKLKRLRASDVPMLEAPSAPLALEFKGSGPSAAARAALRRSIEALAAGPADEAPTEITRTRELKARSAELVQRYTGDPK